MSISWPTPATPHALNPVVDNPRYHFRRADILDRELIAEQLRGFAPDAILHLAAESHVDRSIDGPREVIRTNIEGPAGLLGGALDYWRSRPREKAARFRVPHVSTDEVFGSLGRKGRF